MKKGTIVNRNKRKGAKLSVILLTFMMMSSAVVILKSEDVKADASDQNTYGIKVKGIPEGNATQTDWDIYYCWQNASADYSYATATSKNQGPGESAMVSLAFLPNKHTKENTTTWGTSLDFGLVVRAEANPGWRYDYNGDREYLKDDVPICIKHVKIKIEVDKASRDRANTFSDIYYFGRGEKIGYYDYKEYKKFDSDGNYYVYQTQYPFIEIDENHGDDINKWDDDMRETTATNKQRAEIRKYLNYWAFVAQFFSGGEAAKKTVWFLNNIVFQDEECQTQDIHQTGCNDDYSMKLDWDYSPIYFCGETCRVAGNYYLNGKLNVGKNPYRSPRSWNITANVTFQTYSKGIACEWNVKPSILVTLVPRFWVENGGDYEPSVRAGVVEPIHKDVADFSADGSDDDPNTILYYNWDFGDGDNSRNWSTCPTITHDYAPNSGGGSSGIAHTRSSSTSMVLGGPYNITLKVCDGSHVVTTWTWIDDYPPPVLAPNTNPSGWTSNRQPTIYWDAVTDNCSGLLRYEYQIDATDGTWTPNGLKTSFVTPLLSEGTHNIYVRALDRNKNKGSWGIATAKIDLTAPSPLESVTEGDPDSDLNTTGKYTVHWSTSEDGQSGVANYELQEKSSVDSSWTTLSSTLPNTQHSYSIDHSDKDGVTYHYQVRTKNNVGSWSPFTTSDGILVSTTKPTCSVSSINEDSGSSYLYVSGTTLYYNPAYASSFTIKVEASSTAGLGVAKSSEAFDQTPPEQNANGAIDFTYSFSYSISTGSSWAGTITVTVRDVASRESTTTVYVVHDDTPPTINSAWIDESEILLHAKGSKLYCNGVIGPPNNIVTFSLQGTSYDTDSGLYRATFSPAFGKNPPDDYTPSSWSGKYEDGEIPTTDGDITVTLYDNVNNTVIWAVDYVRDVQIPGTPNITEHHCGTNWTNHNTPYITWEMLGDNLKTIDDGIGSGVRYYYIYDNNEPLYYYYEWGTSIHMDLSDGIHVIFIEARDGVDLDSRESNEITVKIDTVEPYGTIIINNGSIATTSPSVNLTLTTSDDRSGVYRVRFRNWENDGWYRNWGAWEDFNSTKSWTLNNSQGYKKVFYQIMDNAGNIYECNDTIILDWTPPTTSGTPWEPSNADPWEWTDWNWTKPNNRLFWSASMDNVEMDCYELQEDMDVNGNWVTIDDSIEKTYYDFENRGNEIKYQYRVRAKDASGLLSPFSESCVMRTDSVTPYDLDITIDDGAGVSYDRAASLSLGASDSGWGKVHKMRFSYGEAWHEVGTYIDSPHPYPVPYDNTWKIRRVGATKMKVHFEYVDTSTSTLQYVTVHDKNDNEIARYWGYYTHIWTPEVEGETVIIKLHAEGSNESRNGFRIDQYAYYNEYIWSEEEHHINSPHPYPNDYDHTWVIEEPGAVMMQVHFEWIDTEPYRYIGNNPEGGGGSYEEPPPGYWKGDRVLIYDKYGYPNDYLTYYSGNKTDYWTCRVNGDKIYVRLKSDSSDTCEGFYIDGYAYYDSDSEWIWSPWEPYSTSDYSVLPMDNGDKTVYFQVKDYANNIADPVSDMISLSDNSDSSDPVIDLLKIENDKSFTTSSTVELNFEAHDNYPSSGMLVRFSNDNVAWSVWEHYSPSKSWTLANGNDGNRMVYMQVRDTAGNFAEIVSDDIILDANSPDVTLTGPTNDTWINNTRPSFNWTAADPLLGLGLSGTYRIQISNNSDFTDLVIDDTINGSTNNGEANTYTPSEGFSEGAYYWRVNGQDNADNWGVSVQRIIKIDTSSSPPVDNATATLSNDTNDIKVSWKGPCESAEVDYYNIYRRSSVEDEFVLVAAIPNNKTYWVDIGVDTNFNKYSYMVKTVDRAENLGDGLIPPTLVQLYNPTSITSNSMDLEWTQNNDTDFQRYELHKSTTPNFTLDFTSNSTTLYKSSTNRLWTKETVSGLSPSTKYYFKVAVFNTNKLCAISNEVNNTTGQFDLELVAGLNLISMPLDVNDPDDTDPFDAQDLIDLINADGGGALSVSRWLAATGVWDTFNDGGASPFEIKPWEGYFINCNIASTWNVVGKPQESEPVDLVAGLTLTGISMDMGTGYNAQDLINDINADGGDVQAVSRWLAATGVWDTFNDGGASPFIIERGVGYFVNNAMASTWTPG